MCSIQSCCKQPHELRTEQHGISRQTTLNLGKQPCWVETRDISHCTACPRSTLNIQARVFKEGSGRQNFQCLLPVTAVTISEDVYACLKSHAPVLMPCQSGTERKSRLCQLLIREKQPMCVVESDCAAE